MSNRERAFAFLCVSLSLLLAPRCAPLCAAVRCGPPPPSPPSTVGHDSAHSGGQPTGTAAHARERTQQRTSEPSQGHAETIHARSQARGGVDEPRRRGMASAPMRPLLWLQIPLQPSALRFPLKVDPHRIHRAEERPAPVASTRAECRRFAPVVAVPAARRPRITVPRPALSAVCAIQSSRLGADCDPVSAHARQHHSAPHCTVLPSPGRSQPRVDPEFELKHSMLDPRGSWPTSDVPDVEAAWLVAA